MAVARRSGPRRPGDVAPHDDMFPRFWFLCQMGDHPHNKYIGGAVTFVEPTRSSSYISGRLLARLGKVGDIYKSVAEERRH